MRAILLSLAIAGLALGCDEDGDTSDPGAEPQRPVRDAAVVAMDRGIGPAADVGAAPDAASPTDGGSIPDASDPAALDASPLDPDAGIGDAARSGDGAAPAPDAGATPDAAVQPAPDLGPGEPCPAVRGNLLANASFEAWSGGLPDAWAGERTSFSPDNVSEGAPHCGARSLRLANPGDGQHRFTPVAVPALAGHYTATFWARGEGDVRNARHDGGYSGYSGYTTLGGAEWRLITYGFNQAEDTAALELIISVRSTAGDGVEIDDVALVREDGACDGVMCEDWAMCDPGTLGCVARAGACADDGGCPAWKTCGADHACGLRAGRCDAIVDCGGDTPVCDGAHTCVDGDPCDAAGCEAWQACDPGTGACVLAPGRCNTTDDCQGGLPACDTADRRCVEVDDPVNIVPNGGFEAWDDYVLFEVEDAFLPDFWYGLDFGGNDTRFDTEIAPEDVIRSEDAPFDGDYALQIVGGDTADRFTSDAFAVPNGTYACSFRVRGRGTVRQHSYSSAGEHPHADAEDIDSAVWLLRTFTIRSNT